MANNVYLVILMVFLKECGGIPISHQLSPEIIKFRRDQSDLIKSYMKNSVNPCVDFYEYACGNWDKLNAIPSGEDSWSISKKMESADNDFWKELLNSDGSESEDPIQKSKDYFASCINIQRIEDLGTQPLMDYLQELGGWPAITENWDENSDLVKFHIQVEKISGGKLFKSKQDKGLTDPTETLLHITVPTSNLLKTEHYKDDTKLLSYMEYVSIILIKFGASDKEINAVVNDILAFDLKMAILALDDGGLIEITVDDLQNNFSFFDWKKYVDTADFTFNKSKPIVISENFLRNLDLLIKGTSKNIIFNYLGWNLVNDLLPYINPIFEEIRHKTLAEINGQTDTEQPREERCLQETLHNFELAFGSMYAKRYFHKAAEIDVNEFIFRVKESFKEFINNSDWLDNNTKSIMRLKLDNIQINLGYPKIVLNTSVINEKYEKLNINRYDYFGNVIRRKNTSGLNLDWPISIKLADAVYYAQKIFISLMEFRPPLYHKDFSKLLNFAGIGFTIGHELSHSFGPQNIEHDHEDRKSGWISNETLAMYKNKTDCFVDKYNNYSQDGISLDGKNLIEEVLADDMGIKAALRAYKQWIAENGKNPALKNEEQEGFDLSKEQMFFLKWAQGYCTNVRPESWAFLLKNTHPIQRHRVNGVLSNLQSFSDAFHCEAISPMNSKRKCALW